MPNDDGSTRASSRSNVTRVSPPLRPFGPAGSTPRDDGAKEAAADRKAPSKQLSRRIFIRGKAPPVELGRYTVLREIGRGGMGVVYACYDEKLDRRVAVKAIAAETVVKQDVARTRLMREAQALARLNHPNIVSVYEIGEDGPLVYVVMEFVLGVSLDKWIEEAHPWSTVLSTFIQAGRGLAVAHRSGIVHRDFKPHNVMVNEEGLVKVLDFGLARASDGIFVENLLSTDSDASAPPISSLSKALTRTGALLGTPAYMSPEQHRGEVVTAASDQFSFCVSLYQALYGSFPFEGRTYEALRQEVLSGRSAPAPLQSAVPAYIDQALRRGMALDPGQRFASMEELLAALEPNARVARRRTLALVTTAMLLGGASFAAAGSLGTVKQCPDAHAELAGIWDHERIDAVRASVGAALPDGDLSRIERELTGYAEGWVHMRNDACLAHDEGRQSDHLFDLRTSCLDRRRASLSALAETLTAPDRASLNHLLGAAVGLPSLELCADVEALLAEVSLPSDPVLRARVDRAFESLAQADVYYDTSQFRRARDIVEGVLADPEVRTYEPLLARAHLYKAYLQESDGELGPALESYTLALSAALSGGDDIVAAQASSARMFMMALKMNQLDQAKAEMWLVTALNRRVRRDVDTFGRYLHFMGMLHWQERDIERSQSLLKEAVALRTQHGRDRTREQMGTLIAMGANLERVGLHAEAAAILLGAIERAEEIFGLYFADWSWSERLLAYSTINLGRPREALARLQRSHAARTAPELSELYVMFYQHALSRAEFAMGDHAGAYQRMREALRLPPKGSDSIRLAWAWLMLFAAVNGDAEGMQQAAGEALRDLDRIAGRAGHEYQSTLLLHGRALAALARPEEALVPLTSAMADIEGSALWIDVVQRAALSLEMGKARIELGELDVAERDLRDALSGFEQVLTPQNLEIAETMLALAELALIRQLPAESEEWLTRAESIFSAVAERDYPPLVQTRAMLAQLRASAPRSPVQVP